MTSFVVLSAEAGTNCAPPTNSLLALAGAGVTKASIVFQGVADLAEWFGGFIEGADDVYMTHVDTSGTRAVDGGFFPKDANTYPMRDGDQVLYENYLGGEDHYYRFPIDRGSITLQFREHDPVQPDINIGTITIDAVTVASDPRMNMGAICMPADSFGKRAGEGALYQICYSIGMED